MRAAAYRPEEREHLLHVMHDAARLAERGSTTQALLEGELHRAEYAGRKNVRDLKNCGCEWCQHRMTLRGAKP